MHLFQLLTFAILILFSVCYSLPIVGCDPPVDVTSSEESSSPTNATDSSKSELPTALPSDIRSKFTIRKGLPFCNGKQGLGL